MKYLIISVLLLLSGCKNDCCDNIDIGMGIRYRDARGRDWLRANNVTEAGMEVYELVGGQKIRVYQSNFDAPKGIRLTISTDTAASQLQFTPSTQTGANGESLTLLEFPDHSVDTVQCRFEAEDGSIWCINVRYNGKQRWNSAQQTGRIFTVVK